MSDIRMHLGELRTFFRTQAAKSCWMVALVFLAFVLFGYIGCRAQPEAMEMVVSYFQQMVEESGIVSESGSVSPLGLLINNWLAMLFSILYGFIPFLYFPLISVASNAVIIGAMAAYYQVLNLPLTLFLAGILPHGIFELPALFIAGTMGFLLCRNIVRIILHNGRAVPMVELLANILRTLLFVIFPLLVCAALIEAYVTPAIMNLFL